jgi:hypothetical protein
MLLLLPAYERDFCYYCTNYQKLLLGVYLLVSVVVFSLWVNLQVNLVIRGSLQLGNNQE